LSIGTALVNLRFNRKFEWFIIFVIVVTALLAGAKTFTFTQRFEEFFIVLDLIVTVIFCAEILLRYYAEKDKGFLKFLKDPWNFFDSLIVFMSLMPLANSDLVLVARTLRVFRVMRLISLIPELRMLLNSFFHVLPKVGYLSLLMFIIFYIYATIGSTLYQEINPDFWGDVTISMLTLFQIMTLEGWTIIMYEVMEVYPLSWTYFISFIFFTAFAFLNMFIGVVVTVIEEETNLSKKASSVSSDDPADLQRKKMLEGIEILRNEISNMKQDNPAAK